MAKNTFTIEFTKERSKIFTAMMAAAMNAEMLEKFMYFLKEENLLDESSSLFEEYSKKIHERKWCEDTNCDVK